MMGTVLKRLVATVLGCSLSALAATALAQSPPKNFVEHDRPKSAVEIRFEDADGKPHRLADFHGRVVLLNVWATWCGPCRHEMPTLDRLQAKLGGLGFEVVALSVDRNGVDAVRKFYGKISIEHLGIYIASMKVMRQLAVLGLPTTLLLDRQGQEIGRLIGPAEWDTPDKIDFIQSKF